MTWFLDINEGIGHRDEDCPAFGVAISSAMNVSDEGVWGFRPCLQCVPDAKPEDHIRPDGTLGAQVVWDGTK